MGEGTARRKPERRRVVVLLLRRIAVVAVLLALALWFGPRVLTELGLIGPDAAARIAAAERTLHAAQSYGGTEASPAYAAAARELDHARDLQAKGRTREARHAASRATALAIDAQRQALVEAERRRRRAEEVVKALDARVNTLEARFDEVTKPLPRTAVPPLLSSMKEARQAAGAVFLAWEKGETARVLAGEAAARQAIDATSRKLDAARGVP